MEACRLRLLGPPLIERDARIIRIPLRKAVALAAYLTVEQRSFSREYLAALLWSDYGQENAMGNLRRTLSCLRERLGNGCIVAEGDQLRIERSAVHTDADEFHGLLGRSIQDTDLSRLQEAAELYRGSFLEGFSLGNCLVFDEWQDMVRESLETEYDTVLERLAVGHLEQGRLDEALDYAHRWLELDHLNESAHRALMEIHARAGRVDRARAQYESCLRSLARDGLAPDEETTRLNDLICRHQLAPSGQLRVPATELPAASHQPRGTKARRWIALALGAALVLLGATGVWLLAGLIGGTRLSVAGLEVYSRGEELSLIRAVFRNEGPRQHRVDYAVLLASDPVLVTPRDYVVYAGHVAIGRDAEVTVDVDRWTDIAEFTQVHQVRIPPGHYTVSVVVDPDERIVERAPFGSRMSRSDRLFFPGTAKDAAFAIDIAYAGPGRLDHTNPLKVYIGDRSFSSGAEYWGRFVVTHPGTYYFPVADIPRRDRDGSGYFLVIVYDAWDDLEQPLYPEPGDVAAIYKEVQGGLAYGAFGTGSGDPIYPGRLYPVEFSPPAPPGPDAYEVDDYRELATVMDYAELPVLQRHTFHDKGSGDADRDWFRIELPPGATLTVETYSAGGLWEVDTAIDIADEEMRYIRTVVDKSECERYSKLTYVNDTGIGQSFHILVKPYLRYGPGVNRLGEYIVEFRR